jgi:hypothetical protein
MNRSISVRRQLGWRTRGVLVAAAAGLAGLLGLARTLVPDPRGYGTHLQLGLRPCAFARVTGRLCPTCGMTTAFAWFTRGRLDRSWRANPAGCLFAMSSIAVMVWLVACAVRDEPVGFRSVMGPMTGLLLAGVALSLVFWLIRMIVSPASLAGPGPSPGEPVGPLGL